MQIQEFNRLIAKKEGKKKQVNIAQINEIIKVANELTGGKLYRIIKKTNQETLCQRIKSFIIKLASLLGV